MTSSNTYGQSRVIVDSDMSKLSKFDDKADSFN
eukprot:CAMPEP_0170633914 /NCGR_PEP_ID=MMETSP0224-20130122/36284_1 /TAXON_ID=285029 /ORGANISM="Togula jolla, Strain CCCM 725" /LENGTH=32 /DNA_ID= /DNA_START= /DNA_END= /DNA_ORIENTATION=